MQVYFYMPIARVTVIIYYNIFFLKHFFRFKTTKQHYYIVNEINVVDQIKNNKKKKLIFVLETYA